MGSSGLILAKNPEKKAAWEGRPLKGKGHERALQNNGPKPWPATDRKEKAEGLISIPVSRIRGVAGCPRRRGRPGSSAKPEARTRGKASPQHT